MQTAQEIMHSGAQCIAESQTLARAAELMRDLGVGALPICGEDDRLTGIITDRDIVVKCVAQGLDPATTTAGDLAQGRPMVIEGSDDIEQVLRVMEQHRVRRLPVIEHPSHKLIGMISEADVARHLSQARVAEFVTSICAE
jgi:CBS domain-containing protein